MLTAAGSSLTIPTAKVALAAVAGPATVSSSGSKTGVTIIGTFAYDLLSHLDGSSRDFHRFLW